MLPPFIKNLWLAFSSWYEKHYILNVGFASFLFTWQLVHLYWLTTNVVFLKLFGRSFWSPDEFWQYVIIIVDYTEIPAIILVSLVYIQSLQKKFNWKAVLYLIFLNSQLLHIFWITDEFVLEQFHGRASTILPFWLAPVAIAIDYLELPVIFDTFKQFLASLRKKYIKV